MDWAAISSLARLSAVSRFSHQFSEQPARNNVLAANASAMRFFMVCIWLDVRFRPSPYGLEKGLRGYRIAWKRGLRRVSGAYPSGWITCV